MYYESLFPLYYCIQQGNNINRTHTITVNVYGNHSLQAMMMGISDHDASLPLSYTCVSIIKTLLLILQSL